MLVHVRQLPGYPAGGRRRRAGDGRPAAQAAPRLAGFGSVSSAISTASRRLPDCYAAADAFVFASRTETQGLVLLEAMAAGLPVIALSEMGTTDILSPGRGAISPPAEAKAFGETLGNFLNQPSAWHHLRQEAPVYAQEWSDVAMAARLACLYREQAGLKIASERPLTAAA
jgi:1,2-diacylglycerol 3-alpha-glucosyltransferase